MKGKGKIKNKYYCRHYKDMVHIYDPIFRQNYYYIKAKNDREFVGAIKNGFGLDEPERERVCGRCVIWETDGTEQIFIWGKIKANIVHEIIHAVTYTLTKKGIKLEDGSEEVFAYYAEMLFSEIIERGKR